MTPRLDEIVRSIPDDVSWPELLIVLREFSRRERLFAHDADALTRHAFEHYVNERGLWTLWSEVAASRGVLL